MFTFRNLFNMPNKILTIKYQKTYDYKTSFVTGIMGGLATNGMISASFICDRHALPESSIVELNENNIPLKVEEIKGNDMIREAPFGIIMDINTTKLIISWLTNKVREHEDKIK
jgi:hypothetical protein